MEFPLKFCIFLATLLIDVEPPNGSGRPLVFIGLDLCAVKDVFGNVELVPELLLLLDTPVVNLRRFVDI